MARRKDELFGARVRRLREAKHLGLREFARQMGMSPTYLSKIERDELPPPAEERVVAIARALEQDSDEMLALARRVSSDLVDIIRKRPREMASFLRTASGLSAEQLEKLTNRARKVRGEE